MKVCDRHPNERANDGIKFHSDDSGADLCPACVALVRDWLGMPERKDIEPEKPKRGILDRLTNKAKA